MDYIRKRMKEEGIDSVFFDDEEWLTVTSFSKLLGIAATNTNKWAIKGGRSGILPSVKRSGNRWIPVSQIKEYIFCGVGRGNQFYRFNDKLEKVPLSESELAGRGLL